MAENGHIHPHPPTSSDLEESAWKDSEYIIHYGEQQRGLG